MFEKMRFYNSRNTEEIVILTYILGIFFLQFWINIDFCQGAVVSLSTPQIHFDGPPPPSNSSSPTGGR